MRFTSLFSMIQTRKAVDILYGHWRLWPVIDYGID